MAADWSEANLQKLLGVLVGRGYGKWEAIRQESRLNWSLADIARSCRQLVLLLLYWSSITSTDTPASQDADADGFAAAATGEPGAKSKAKSAKTSAVVGAGSDGNDPMVLDGEATAAGTVSVGLDLLETQL